MSRGGARTESSDSSLSLLADPLFREVVGEPLDVHPLVFKV